MAETKIATVCKSAGNYNSDTGKVLLILTMPILLLQQIEIITREYKHQYSKKYAYIFMYTLYIATKNYKISDNRRR